MCKKVSDSSSDRRDFIKAQYNQYWQMKRFHLSLSWNVPTMAVAATIVFIGLDFEQSLKWFTNPFIPACIFSVLTFFFFTMFVHHIRNSYFAQRYESALIELEKSYGELKEVYHSQETPDLSLPAGISSSFLLSVLLLLFIAVSSSLCIAFWWLNFHSS